MGGLHPLVAQLQARRLELGISQQKIADVCGVHKNTVSRWETNAKTPSLENLVAYADAVGLDLVAAERGQRPVVPPALARRRGVLQEVEITLGNTEGRIGRYSRLRDGTGQDWVTMADAASREAALADSHSGLTWALRLRDVLAGVLVAVDARTLRRALLATAAAIVAWVEELDDRDTA